ncbi:putative toxin-antitoxin system toxin component, PIN family [Candidatus Poribacteria bacterium]|nr:putative toxin-antitoxin system toxin component, PIN family [Candidatus Poribacteria bacterium]MYK18711.1 putative toxin-antitoxin system toxin component, PIN family [Candidatus Poribacteria bacterium]
MRVVLDTNQHISAIIRPNGHPAQIVKLWRIGLIELAVSPFILEEFESVVHRPRIQEKNNLSDADIAEYLEILRTFAIIVPGTIIVNAVPDDPDDDDIIACAIESEADVIISGDQHLLSLGSYQGIPIVKAVDFLSDYISPR